MERIVFILSLLAVAGDGRVLNSEEHDAKHLLYEDGLVTQEMERLIPEEDSVGSRRKRQAWTPSDYLSGLWLGGVDYTFAPDASERLKRIFRKAAKLWEQDTCIDFRENDTAKDRIFVWGAGTSCNSPIGKTGGEQVLLLGRGCETIRTASHEIGHALGFIHTMGRHDRDDYVTINFENIQPKGLNEFYKYPLEANNNYGLGYDFGSIMHYEHTSYGKMKYPTMIPSDANYGKTMGSPFISFIDLSMMNEHYKCKERCQKGTSVTCERGGFPHPRDCQKCICPGGYGGTRCTERPEGCGETLQASTEWQTLRDTLGDHTIREDYTKCHYWIQSPNDTIIEVQLALFTRGIYNGGCQLAGVEIKTNEDQTLTGYIFCSSHDKGTTLRSHSNLVPVITYNRYLQTRVWLKYRYVPASSQAPSTNPSTITTEEPSDTEKGNNCVEEPMCPALVKDGFCTMKFPQETKKKICPKSCGFC